MAAIPSTGTNPNTDTQQVRAILRATGASSSKRSKNRQSRKSKRS